METECHCLYCPRHPLHSKRGKIESLTGYDPTRIIAGSDAGRLVDCLKPDSPAFYEFNIDYENERFPVTAYGDGASMTGFNRDGITVYATCINEEYRPPLIADEQKPKPSKKGRKKP